MERKRSIKKIYDGYVFQVYAQYYALTEMGYDVQKIIIHDLLHNKNYRIPIPSESPEWTKKFDDLMTDIRNFKLLSPDFTSNKEKCDNCIYANLCDFSLC